VIKGEPLGGGVVVDIKWSGGVEVKIEVSLEGLKGLLAWELSSFSHVGGFLPGLHY
jgi:hypothetical protein